ncbi:MAG: undecaprenyldiphospho-muramoylpentapeptide beta-N-acetylglucosaminyltransferase [Bacteroidia bacterium]|nr:undecaprenyldiphospho-muramoylpentapeptide beta-N-acetylglucosaminyltransferase [Bacteroidia bacterium]
MSMQKQNLRVIISGGGTGGHIFPAISIANALKQKDSNTEILFVGAEGKMEMEKVPAAGYKIIGLPVRGFQRKLTFQNISFFYKLLVSIIKARKIIKSFKPDIVVGVGGFASGPILRAATRMNIPTLIQEQNSFAGVTNKILGNKVNKVCVAYDNMERFFPKEKIVFTGNPVRQDLIDTTGKKHEEALLHFGLQGNKKTILVIGGSLGAKTINSSIEAGLNKIADNKLQLIWQTGKDYFYKAKESASKFNNDEIKVADFISRMDLAYSIADVVISRAGASTISELCIVKKPSILVPSPNVAEDHQTKNAMALFKNDAAMMITDAEAPEKLVDEVIKLLKDEFLINVYRDNCGKMAVTNSAEKIANEIISIIESHP